MVHLHPNFAYKLTQLTRQFFQDHVYCSPSWDSRDGTPYSVARIMQFLPPEDAPKGEEGKNYLYTRVRLAWYYRPSDVSDRPVADPRLLLAAIYSEVCDINQLRAKCHVVHRDKISDLSGWKKRPDRFYFNRLFDPYIKKEFDVIPSHDVRNRKLSCFGIFPIGLLIMGMQSVTTSEMCLSRVTNSLLLRKKSSQTWPTIYAFVILAKNGVLGNILLNFSTKFIFNLSV